MSEQLDFFNSADTPSKEVFTGAKDDLSHLSLQELRVKFKELTGFSGYALDEDKMRKLIASNNAEEALVALREAEAVENAQDIQSPYIR